MTKYPGITQGRNEGMTIWILPKPTPCLPGLSAIPALSDWLPPYWFPSQWAGCVVQWPACSFFCHISWKLFSQLLLLSARKLSPSHRTWLFFNRTAVRGAKWKGPAARDILTCRLETSRSPYTPSLSPILPAFFLYSLFFIFSLSLTSSPPPLVPSPSSVQCTPKPLLLSLL